MTDHLAAAQRDLEDALAVITSAQDHLEALAPPPISGVITDREPRPLPALPAIQPGQVITDPTFGARILRVTGPTSSGASFRTPDSGVQRAWNADSTRFVSEDTYGQQHVFWFEPEKFRVRRRSVVEFRRRTPGGHEIVAFNGSDASWHDTDPDLLFGRYGNRIIKSYNVVTNTWATIVDLDTLGLDLPEDSYTGGVYVQNNHLLTVCGGAANDLNHWLVYIDLENGNTDCLDTLGLTQFNDGKGFTVHGSVMDLSARYVLMQPASGSGDTTHLYIWEPGTNHIRQVSTAISGHFSVGHGVWVTQDCKPGTAWDAAQWCFRDFQWPDEVTNIIEPVLEPKEMYLADHSCWTSMHDLADPFISATYRHRADPCPWRAWDEEILRINCMSGVVERHAHHRSSVITEAGGFDYWATPRANLSCDGKWAIFTSNWGRSLGTDLENNARQDVFLVELRGTQGTTPTTLSQTGMARVMTELRPAVDDSVCPTCGARIG